MGGVILVVDDSATLRRQICNVLAREGTFDAVLEAPDGLAALRIALEQRPDLVLCDLVMPGLDGLKFLAMCANHERLRQIPVIMLTAEDDLDRKAEILDAGASDYVTKPFHDKELLARVRVHLRLKLLQDELRRANERLEVLSATDPLTGLFNRRRLEAVLADELAHSARTGVPLSVVLSDIDHFKRINDTYGHEAGDEVLRNVARMFREHVRASDAVARYGGEEIVLVLPRADLACSLQISERLRNAIEHTTHAVSDATIRATASFGVACFDGTGPAPAPEQLVRRADQALYVAKSAGRNRVVAWDPSHALAKP